ncbi:hypothetical protein [Mucilaginibacter celer]|uniref:Uncharacterized protein n=1 Tax=Mucilaginibacter celer TaxID=2305508 RepID=A0A494VZS1_9SPHI|nr:hypothetical protein [Mucilaginibacter celer]AYL96462.1 hypothetical protein HYN43_014655 [Mucilaginibacter celer]
MQINYFVVGGVIIVLIVLVVWIIKTNLKDEKDFEQQIIESEMKPKEHEKSQKEKKGLIN